MSIEHERSAPHNPPSPRQIDRLASVGVSFAAEREKLKTLRSAPHSHYHVDEIDLCAPDDFGDLTQIRHRMAGRVGVRKDYVNGNIPIWSYKLFDTRWVYNGEQWVASRVLYRFEHNRRQTLLADRCVKALGLAPVYGYDEDEPLFSQLEHFRVRDDEATVLAVQQDFEAITAEECELLLQEAVAYTEVIRQISH